MGLPHKRYHHMLSVITVFVLLQNPSVSRLQEIPETARSDALLIEPWNLNV